MLSLTSMRAGMADKIAQQVVDVFIRESEILELLPFDNSVSPSGGSTLVYGYVQEKLPSTAAFRAIGDEYVSNEATLQQLSVILKPFGGSFQVDRIIKSIEAQLESLDHQVRAKVKAAVGVFHDTMINGDTAVNSKAFDGLNKMLVGSSTEYNTTTHIDLSTIAKVKDNADEVYEALLKLINTTNADAIMVNETMKTKIQTVARVLGYKTESEMSFGRVVTTIGENGVRIIDLKNNYSVDQNGAVVTTPIIGTQTRRIGSTDEYILTTDTALVTGKTYYTKALDVYTAVASPDVADIATYYEKVKTEVTGLTDIYAAKFDIFDGFHGATVTGDKIIESFLPDFTKPGAVKTGEIEMVAAVALKNSRNAGVLRNIKIV